MKIGDLIIWSKPGDPFHGDPLLLVAEELSPHTVYVDDHEELVIENYTCIRGDIEIILPGWIVHKYFKVLSSCE